MAKVYGDAAGLARFCRDEDDAALLGPPPPGALGPVEFDPATNAALVEDIRASPAAYALPGGVLTKGGEAVAINPPGASFLADADRGAARQLVIQVAQSAVGVRFDQLTAAQVRALVAILFWQEGALTGTGQVRPLAAWVRD